MRARIRARFPGAAEVEGAAAIVAVEAGADAAEEGALRMLAGLRASSAAEADVEFGEEAGELHGPEAEVGDGAPDGAGCAGAQVIEHGRQKAEIFFVRLGGGQELLGNFGEEVERAGGMEVAREGRTANAEVRRNRC